MRSKQFVWVAMLVLAGTTGCAMCDNAQDGTYAAFGGKWQRDNLYSGRVASLFDPADGQVIEQQVSGQDAPTEADSVPEGMEQTEESAEPVVEQAEEATEAAKSEMETPKEAAETAEPQREDLKEEAAEAVTPKKADGEQAKGGAKAGTDKKPVGGILELPVLPAESAESPKPESNNDGLLPPLEPPPQ